jgi:hypothetical protein
MVINRNENFLLSMRKPCYDPTPALRLHLPIIIITVAATMLGSKESITFTED